MLIPMLSCGRKEEPAEVKIILLHHSTGGLLWEGNKPSKIYATASRISVRLAAHLKPDPQLPSLVKKYNKKNDKNLNIEEEEFPNTSKYEWTNNPFDYYNIWVKNAGSEPFRDQPTLEILTKHYNLIIFKHCFPVCNIEADKDSSDINSDLKTISNYKLQYLALKDKLLKFPDTKFVVFTGAAQVKFNVPEDEARRAQEFFRWVTNDWDTPGDNIHIWDFYSLQTEGELYFRDEYAMSSKDSHPNRVFAGAATNLLFNRLIDVINNNGNGTLITGELK
jgi:hypothetical protein